MSWENTECQCGGVKEQETMLCPECEAAFANHPAMAAFKSNGGVEYRRQAAITLVSLARGRSRERRKQRDLPLSITVA